LEKYVEGWHIFYLDIVTLHISIETAMVSSLSSKYLQDEMLSKVKYYWIIQKTNMKIAT